MVNPYDPVRFSVLSTREQAELAASEPGFARLVCRCELVTEAEIVDAIDRGARTLDGVKFRTRAGMGRCQGGFCTWRCLELVADVLGTGIDVIVTRELPAVGQPGHLDTGRAPPASETRPVAIDQTLPTRARRAGRRRPSR